MNSVSELFLLNENLGGKVYGSTLFLPELNFCGKPNMREKKAGIELRVKNLFENYKSRHLIPLKTSFLF